MTRDPLDLSHQSPKPLVVPNLWSSKRLKAAQISVSSSSAKIVDSCASQVVLALASSMGVLELTIYLRFYVVGVGTACELAGSRGGFASLLSELLIFSKILGCLGFFGHLCKS